MKNWKAINEEKPPHSGLYKVIAECHLLSVKCARYIAEIDRWIDDDGWWLPMDVTPYITHWNYYGNEQ